MAEERSQRGAGRGSHGGGLQGEGGRREEPPLAGGKEGERGEE